MNTYVFVCCCISVDVCMSIYQENCMMLPPMCDLLSSPFCPMGTYTFVQVAAETERFRCDHSLVHRSVVSLRLIRSAFVLLALFSSYSFFLLLPSFAFRSLFPLSSFPCQCTFWGATMWCTNDASCLLPSSVYDGQTTNEKRKRKT